MNKHIPELSINKDIKFNLIELQAGEQFETSGNVIVTVVKGEIKDRLKGRLQTFESSAYHAGKVEATEHTLLSVFQIKELDMILNKIDVNGDFGDYCRENWTRLSGLPGCEALDYVDLYRGDQVEKEFQGVKYKFNLWFCGPEVDCLFHNQHDFEEIHTGIAGDGFMQKTLGTTDKELLETVAVMPGTGHKRFDIEGEKEENGSPKYPMHRWLGGKTGNIWLVIEKY